MATITTPVKDYTGRVAGVDFKDGTGSTDDEAAIAYFERAGYTVSGSTDDAGIEDQDEGLLLTGGAMGRITDNPPGPLDAADPDNDLVPVGGVKSAAAPEAPARPTRRRRSNTSDAPADVTPQQPVTAGGTTAEPDGSQQSAPSATTATTPSAAPEGDKTAADYSSATPAPDPAKPVTVDPSAAKDQQAREQEQAEQARDRQAEADQQAAADQQAVDEKDAKASDEKKG